jgi:hypothetical protein
VFVVHNKSGKSQSSQTYRSKDVVEVEGKTAMQLKGTIFFGVRSQRPGPIDINRGTPSISPFVLGSRWRGFILCIVCVVSLERAAEI